MRFFRFSAVLFIVILFVLPWRLNAQEVPGEIIVKLRLRTVQVNRQRPVPSFAPVLKSLQSALVSAAPLFTPLPASAKSAFSRVKAFGSQFLLLRVKSSVSTDSLRRRLNGNPAVAYAVPNHLFRIDWTPNDPDLHQQWGIRKIEAPKAWDLTRGVSSVLLAIIDTGVEYTHPDLKAALWVNPGEDLNHNGVVDSSDFNGVDDDHNGFVDDIRGWDFVDAPHYPDAGDYLNRDNNPDDENGHGTAIAGILAAQADNGIGVAGVAPGCRVMNLRAGTSRGLLEEDDVAAALLYAVENGARVVNMSFGDVALTPFLRDVIQFAYARGVLCVASSGNDGNDKMHYPSGLSETLSVGASTRYDGRAPFSNFGFSLDLTAPGYQIYTTERGGKYGSVSGTSASAPFVTGVAGLVLSRNPTLGVQTLRHILTSTCDDVGEAGWDTSFGAGRLNAFRAVQAVGAPIAEIRFPRTDAGFASGTIPIVGTAASPLFDHAEIRVGMGDSPENWHTLRRLSFYQAIDETLAVWPVPQGPDTSYTLQVAVWNRDSTTERSFTRLFVDHTPPHLVDTVQVLTGVAGNRTEKMVGFNVDDVCSAELFYRKRGSSAPFGKKTLPYPGKHVAFLLDPDSFPAAGEFYLNLKNRAGLETRIDQNGSPFVYRLDPPFLTDRMALSKTTSIPAGYVFNKVTDFNRDGRPEVVLNRFRNHHSFGGLAIYQWQGGEFQKKYETPYVLIPRDVADTDGDGWPELLAGAGGRAYLFHTGADGWPSQLVWWDTLDIWAAQLADLDGDGKPDILARRGVTYKLFHNYGQNHFVATDSFPNFTQGGNGVGVPHVEIGDFNGNGKTDLLFGDYDGDVYVYEIQGAGKRPKPLWQTRLPLGDAIDFLASGDFDGDGVTDFAVACHSTNGVDLEHQFDERRWLARIYTHDSEKTFTSRWQQVFFDYHGPQQFSSGLSASDVTGDGRAELLLSFYPHFYVVHFDPQTAHFGIIWTQAPARSRAAVVHDFDGDGRSEFYFDTGSGLTGWEFQGGPSSVRLFSDFSAVALDSQRVRLHWRRQNDSVKFRVFRSISGGDSLFLATVQDTQFVDSTVAAGRRYAYFLWTESVLPQRSVTVWVRPHVPTRLLRGSYRAPNQFRLLFSEPLSEKSVTPDAFSVRREGEPSAQPVHSSALARGKTEVILTLAAPRLPEGRYTIWASTLVDSEGTPVDKKFQSVDVAVSKPARAFFLTRAEFLPPRQIRLTFNLPVDSASAVAPAHFKITPTISVVQSVWRPEKPAEILLKLGSERPVGALGLTYHLFVQNVRSAGGETLAEGPGSQAAFVFFQKNLSRVFVYPNPVREGIDASLVFANLTRKATVQVFDFSGRPVVTLKETDSDGGVCWDLRDSRGRPVPAGIYLYRVSNQKESKWGKLAVVR